LFIEKDIEVIALDVQGDEIKDQKDECGRLGVKIVVLEDIPVRCLIDSIWSSKELDNLFPMSDPFLYLLKVVLVDGIPDSPPADDAALKKDGNHEEDNDAPERIHGASVVG
jgi:hypothetical protein